MSSSIGEVVILIIVAVRFLETHCISTQLYTVAYAVGLLAFLPRDAMHARSMPSCGVSVTFVHSAKTNKHIFNFLLSGRGVATPF